MKIGHQQFAREKKKKVREEQLAQSARKETVTVIISISAPPGYKNF